jgi:hypothetical protein
VTRGTNKAVVDGSLLHVSASQVRTYLRCPRLWVAEKILGLRQPTTPAQARGQSAHSRFEAYYVDGALPELYTPGTEAFLAALPGLPPRHPSLLVEVALEEPKLYVEDVRFDGYSDLVIPPGVAGPAPQVWDWKVVSSFRYTQDPSEDLQMLIYGYWASIRWPEAHEVDVVLAYFAAKGSDFKLVKKTVPMERCVGEWRDVVMPAVMDMRAVAASVPVDFLATPGNFTDDYAACRAYGGCAHLKKCGIDLHAENDKVNKLLRAFDEGLA